WRCRVTALSSSIPPLPSLFPYTTLFRSTVGHGKVYVNGELIVDEDVKSEHTDLGAALMAPPTAAAEVSLAAGAPVELRFEYRLRSEEHTSELQSPDQLVCRLLLEKKQKQ